MMVHYIMVEIDFESNAKYIPNLALSPWARPVLCDLSFAIW